MYSPRKLCNFEKNYLEINSNLELSNKLSTFFEDSKNDYLWKISKVRQTVSYALRHTEQISLRKLKVNAKLDSTAQYNQILNTVDTDIIKIPIFEKAVEWLKLVLSNENSDQVEFGRIFFSKHFSNSSIDEHIDDGKYFDYFDRFHFVIDQIDNENVFHIRDEDVYLQKGKLYWVNNHVPHYLKNNSNKDRINLIFDARLT